VTWYLILGIVITLAVAALIVQLFLMWSARRGWFTYQDPED
jgi:hypothetical protein